MATRPTCGLTLILFLAVKCWGALRWWRLCSQPAHLWANPVFVPPFGGGGDAAPLSTCGLVLILSPALRRCGSRKRQARRAQWCAYSDFVCRYETGDPLGGRDYVADLRLWASSDFVPPFEGLGTPQAVEVM